MNNKYLLLLAGLGGALYLLYPKISIAGSISENTITDYNIDPQKQTKTTKSGSDYLDKFALDNLDSGEAKLASKLWEKAQPYTASIEKYSREFGVPTTLIYAIINKESVFVPTSLRYEANVKQKAFGLMQILPTTAEQMGFSDDEFQLIVPDVNLKYGIKYLGYQLNRYSGDVNDAVSAYNAGTVIWTAGGKYINQNYVNDVLRIYNLLNKVIKKG